MLFSGSWLLWVCKTSVLCPSHPVSHDCLQSSGVTCVPTGHETLCGLGNGSGPIVVVVVALELVHLKSLISRIRFISKYLGYRIKDLKSTLGIQSKSCLLWLPVASLPSAGLSKYQFHFFFSLFLSTPASVQEASGT